MLPETNCELRKPYDCSVVRCSKEPEILDISIVGEVWMKKCKVQTTHLMGALLNTYSEFYMENV